MKHDRSNCVEDELYSAVFPAEKRENYKEPIDLLVHRHLWGTAALQADIASLPRFTTSVRLDPPLACAAVEWWIGVQSQKQVEHFE